MEKSYHPIVQTIFYGNYFYGFCAVALSIEAGVQQQLGLLPILYYIIVFCGTILYYTWPYLPAIESVSGNARTIWYYKNTPFIRWSQRILVIVTLIGFGKLLGLYEKEIIQQSISAWALWILFPLIGLLYYGIGVKSIGFFNLRQIGWLKPIVIGIAWAGCVTYYPALFYAIFKGISFELTAVGALLFLKNTMFITVLGIMFDIKDFAHDHQKQLKTFVVHSGLRKTLFYIILPLVLLGLGSFLIFGIIRHFHPLRLLFNTIPFALLIWSVFTLQKRRSILYYLTIIDGLMLVKAICGTAGMIF